MELWFQDFKSEVDKVLGCGKLKFKLDIWVVNPSYLIIEDEITYNESPAFNDVFLFLKGRKSESRLRWSNGGVQELNF